MDVVVPILFRVMTAVTAFAGTLLLSPSGTRLICSAVAASVRSHLPVNRQGTRGRTMRAHQTAEGVALVDRVETEAWPGPEDLTGRTEALRKEISLLKSELHDQRLQAHAEFSAITASVRDLEIAVANHAGEAKRLRLSMEYDQAKLDAHGLFPMALSIAMAAVPDEWAKVYWVAAPLIGLAIGSLSAAFWGSFRTGAWRKIAAPES